MLNVVSIDIDEEGLERMAKRLYDFHAKISKNLGTELIAWEKVRDQALEECVGLMKAYHGVKW